MLKKSSRVNGKLIPLWRDPRLPGEYVYNSWMCPRKVDRNRDQPDQPELARAQLARSATWKLPAELCSNCTHSSDEVEPQDIAQRIISDCSVCASIVVCLAHHKRFSSKVRFLGFSGYLCLSASTVGTIVPSSASRSKLGRTTSTLPIRRGIQLQRKLTPCKSSDYLRPLHI